MKLRVLNYMSVAKHRPVKHNLVEKGFFKHTHNYSIRIATTPYVDYVCKTCAPEKKQKNRCSVALLLN